MTHPIDPAEQPIQSPEVPAPTTASPKPAVPSVPASLTTTPAPLASQPAPAQTPAQSAEDQQPQSVEIFCMVSGHKPDQVAPFLRHARACRLGARTIAEWRVAWDEFLRRPIRS